ncbi:endonuclease/exonuclease/phosphatase family protein, partial [Amnibacterium sp.]|uniref:endonuclease/exonuclease/phosphatase family protein n=1 Tax=Amnibacterium sp. TaxID=1872496 RepID=UPI003F7C1C63
MRITTLNLQGFLDWDARAPRIAAFLRGVDPDVVLFQEVVYLPDVSPYSPVELLNRELRMPFRHEAITRLQRGRAHPVYREGLALLSRVPLAST